MLSTRTMREKSLSDDVCKRGPTMRRIVGPCFALLTDVIIDVL